MSKFSVYINLPLYLKEWVTHHLGEPVVFPYGSPQNAVMRTFLTKPPCGFVPRPPEPKLTAIAIPDSLAKPAGIYNHLSEQGAKAVAETIKDLFLRNLWADINPIHPSGAGLNTLINAWCQSNGIGIDRAETVRQCYYRIRKRYEALGITLRDKSRKK